MTQIQSIIRCTDFTTEFLLLAAHEAMACQALSVAISSLSNLLNFYSPGHEIPITEIILLRTITTILMQEPEFEPEVLKFMMKSQSRAAELGPDAFFGKGEVGKRERNWFAMTSWNVGIKCGGKKKYELCAEFMRLASVFYSYYMVDEEVEGNNVMVCKCIILTVSAMIAAEKQKKVSMSDAELKQAVELLDRAKKMLESLSIGKKLADLDNNIDPNLFFTHTLNAYELYGRLNDSTSQLLVVKNYANSKACTMTHLLRLGLTASHGPDSNPEVATFALNACLSSLLTSPQPDYRTVALTIRRLISVSILYKGDTDDDVVYNMYKQAYRIMVGLKEGEYPGDEGKWLATTAWNRGSIPVRLGQVDVARKWVKMGLDLAKKVQGMETYVACMEDYVSGFEKKINDKDQQLESLQMNSS